MKALALHILGGDNPANILGWALADGRRLALRRTGRPPLPPWRMEIAASLLEQRCGEEELIRWARIESLNMGSIQRLPCPIKGLRGSGRWYAQDEGGHYALLREEVLFWARRSSQERSTLILLAQDPAVSAQLLRPEQLRAWAEEMRAAREAKRAAEEALSADETPEERHQRLRGLAREGRLSLSAIIT